jgi:DNA-binding MarR family transcriptional regulator
MSLETRTTSGETVTDVILATFRANGLLLEAGDRLTSRHGLTAARWQVLGAVALADQSLTVPHIARRMGLTRQSVHATVGRLVEDGAVDLVPNDDHRRSRLVRLTEAGRRAYAEIDREQAAWVNELARGIPRSDLAAARRVLNELVDRLGTERAEERPAVAGDSTRGSDR